MRLAYIITAYKDAPQLLRLVPSEMCIQTIIFNSKYAKHAIICQGEYKGLVHLAPLHYFVYNKEIKIFDDSDFENLTTCI